MPYIQRDENNAIIGVFAQPQECATEFTAEDIDIDISYSIKRATAYPALPEFADAFYWLQKGDASKMAAYLAACDAVKAAFPKPEETA